MMRFLCLGACHALGQRWCVGFLLWLAVVQSLAQAPNWADSKPFRTCMDRVYDHGFITENQVNCVRAELKKYDAMLNAEYQRQLKLSQGDSRQKLVKAQRDWLRFRDAWCAFEFSVTEVPPNIFVKREMCLADFTAEQWYRLKSVR